MADDTEQQPIRQPPRREISRRPVVIGLIGLVVVEAVAGGINWKVLSQGLHKIALAFAPPIPTPISPATILFLYKGHLNGVNEVKWFPDNKRIVSGADDQTAQVWDATTGRRALIYRSQTGRVLTVACSPDGKHIASAGASPLAQPPVVASLDQTSGPASGGTILTITGSGFTKAIGVAFGLASVPCGVDNTCTVDSDTQITVVIPAENPSDASASVPVDVTVTTPNGTSVTSSADLFTYTPLPSPVVSRLDSFTYASPLPIPTDSPVPTPVPPTPVPPPPTPAPIPPFVEVWDASTGKTVLIYKGHTKAANSVAWSPDGKRLTSGSSDKTVQVWDATTGKHVITYAGHTDAVNSVAWSLDGVNIASGSRDKTVQMWDAATGNLIIVYTGHTDVVNSVTWSPDGRHIASASNDATVRIWSTAARTAFIYKGHVTSVKTVAWSPDGMHLASAGRDTTVQIWKAV